MALWELLGAALGGSLRRPIDLGGTGVLGQKKPVVHSGAGVCRRVDEGHR